MDVYYTMLLLDVFISMYEGIEGNLYVMMISYINLVYDILHYFLLDHAYK